MENVCFVERMSAFSVGTRWPLGVGSRLLEKSNIRKACKTCSDRKAVLRDSEPPTPLRHPGTAEFGHERAFTMHSFVSILIEDHAHTG